MKLAQSRRRALVAFAFTASACGFYATSPAAAYDDKTTITAVMEMVGASTDEDAAKIDYRERPKVVLPPNRQALPEPQARGDARSSGFPAGPEAARARESGRYARATASQAGVAPGAEPSRDLLTEPPSGYRRATQDLSKIREPEEKSSWTNPIGMLKQTASGLFGN